MKKIAFLGDSIRMGYAPRTMALLGDGYEYINPEFNCRFAKFTLRSAWEMRTALSGSEVIHWNNGLWDICDLFGDGPFTPEEEYVSTMLRTAKYLQTLTRTLIFATTTPVDPRNPHDKNERIERFNSLIVPSLREIGVVINDLHAVIARDVPAYICEDRIHLTPEGIEAAAAHNAAVIRRYL